MDLSIIKDLMKNGGSPSELIASQWPLIEELLHQLFDIHSQKVQDDEYLVFALTQNEDQEYYIMPGAVNMYSEVFRQVHINLEGEEKYVIKLDADTISRIIENANKPTQPENELPKLDV